MSKDKYLLLTSCSVAALGFSSAANALETISYAYDPLGRLIQSGTTGGPNNGTTTAICIDPAGNRQTYAVTVGGAASCTPTPTPAPSSPPAPPPPPPPPPAPPPPPPPPPPSPPPGDQPPVATADSVSLTCYTSTELDLTANDYDPDGNNPLVLVSITLVGADPNPPAAAQILSPSTVEIDAGYKGVSYFSYVVRDSLWATSTGSLTVTATGSNAYCSNNTK